MWTRSVAVPNMCLPDADSKMCHPGLRSKQVSYRTPVQPSVIPDSDPGSMVLRGDGPRVFARGDKSEVFAVGDKSEGFALVTKRKVLPDAMRRVFP